MGDVRKSVVGELSVLSVDNSSAIEIGDTERLAPVSRVLAVQRQEAIFPFGEFAMRNYAAYSRPVPLPVVAERLVMKRDLPKPPVHVGSIRIIAVSSSVIIQVGSSCELLAESRIKHIRHLFREPPAGAGKEK
jgi:spore germination protein PE